MLRKYFKKINKISLFFCITLIIFFVFVAGAERVFTVSESTNYRIEGGQINAISKKLTGTLYNMETGGAIPAGALVGSSYNVRAGTAFSETTASTPTPTPSGGGGGNGGGPNDYPEIPPVEVENVEAINLGAVQVRIKFNTDKLAVTYLQYGINNQYNFSTNPELSYSYNHEFLLYNLLPNTKYNFRMQLKNLQNKQNQSATYNFTTIRVFKAVPNVSNLTAKASPGKIELFWNNPKIIDFAGIKLVRNAQHFPNSLDDGVLLFDGVGEYYADTGVSPNQKYYYTLFTYDTSFNYSSGAIITGIIKAEGEEIIPKEEEKVEEETKPKVKKDEDIIIPAQPPELPPDLVPIAEEEKVVNKIDFKKGIIDFFSLIKQSIAREYEKITRIFVDIFNMGLQRINSIKEGLVDQAGQLQQDIFDKLTPKEKEQLEVLIEQPLPVEYDFEKINTTFADAFSKNQQRINSIKEGLVDQAGQLQQDIFDQLTEKEKEEIEVIIEKPLPKIYDYEKINRIFANFISQTYDRLNSIKEGLVDKAGQLQQDIYEKLTPKEREEVEKIIEQPLAPVFEYSSVVKVLPFSFDEEVDEADWHVFADSNSLLSISATVFDKPVNTIIATLYAQSYVLRYNPNTGNYEAMIATPSEKGKYQILVHIIYEDNTYEEINRVVLVDPYGYVYIEKYQPWSWKKPWQIFYTEEIRVPTAKVTLYSLNQFGKWDIWPANFYKQFNPQTTGETGEFIFLAPPGKYYLTAEAIGYKKFVGKEFESKEEIININIKLNNLFTWQSFGRWIARWGLVVLGPLAFLTSLLLFGVKLGIKIGMKKRLKNRE